MSEANKIQHGGDHYQSTFQHWDLVHRMRLGYYAGCSSKYIARHWKKNGREDLAKAGHFLQKWIEVIECGQFPYPPYESNGSIHYTSDYTSANPGTPFSADFTKFLDKNGLNEPDFELEREALNYICMPQSLRDLQKALEVVRMLAVLKYPHDEMAVGVRDTPEQVNLRPEETGMLVNWGSPLDDFYHEGYLGGGEQGQDLYQCRHCGAHVRGPANVHPLSHHNCQGKPLHRGVSQYPASDGSEPGPAYTNQ